MMRIDFPPGSRKSENACVFCGATKDLLKYNGLIMCTVCIKDRNIHGDFLDGEGFEAAIQFPGEDECVSRKIIWADDSVFRTPCVHERAKTSGGHDNLLQ